MDIILPFSELLPVGVCRFSDLGDSLFQCAAKRRLMPGAESIIVYLFPYYLGEDYYRELNISKYAVPEDYHITALSYLNEAVNVLKADFPGFSFEAFCDNSPINEVKAAVLAGLGCKGENSLLINEKYGSFCFIGEIVTDMKITPNEKIVESCLKCNRCKTLCPMNALRAGGVEKASCLSEITQKKGELTPAEIEKIAENGCAWGCDICQDVCPMNKDISLSPIKEFYKTAKAHRAFGESIENRAFSWRGEKVINRNLEILYCQDEKNNL